MADGDLLTLEQVRRAMNVYLDSVDLSRGARNRRYQNELDRQRYYQARNALASRSHTKTRRQWFEQHGIDVDRIKSLDRKNP